MGVDDGTYALKSIYFDFVQHLNKAIRVGAIVSENFFGDHTVTERLADNL